MKSVRIMKFWICLLMPATFGHAQPLTLDFKSVKLSAEQRASLQHFLTDTSPELSFDWNSLETQSHSIARERRQLSASLNTVPALTAAGVCRSEQHHFHAATAAGKSHWLANEELTSFQAWIPQGGNCAMASSRIEVGKSLSDADFLFIERQKDALRAKAAGVIGGSDCARVRFCEVTLRRINRLHEETPSRILTKLTFTPVKPSPACLYVMEVSFVGPLNDLVPLGASCPRPWRNSSTGAAFLALLPGDARQLSSFHKCL